jgi:hypothetical protein
MLLDKLPVARRLQFLPLVLTGLTSFGCAHSPAPMRVRFADINHGALQGYTGAAPLLVEFQKGDRVPVNFELTGEGFELDPSHPALELVATQHCFLRVGSDGFRLGLDPDHLDDKPRKPGSFRIGFGAARGQPAKVEVVIAAPQR